MAWWVMREQILFTQRHNSDQGSSDSDNKEGTHPFQVS